MDDDIVTDAAVTDRLARIETKIDGLVTTSVSAEARTQQKLADHDARLRTVERICWGFVAVAGAGLIGGGSAAVTSVVK